MTPGPKPKLQDRVWLYSRGVWLELHKYTAGLLSGAYTTCLLAGCQDDEPDGRTLKRKGKSKAKAKSHGKKKEVDSPQPMEQSEAEEEEASSSQASDLD